MSLDQVRERGARGATYGGHEIPLRAGTYALGSAIEERPGCRRYKGHRLEDGAPVSVEVFSGLEGRAEAERAADALRQVSGRSPTVPTLLDWTSEWNDHAVVVTEGHDSGLLVDVIRHDGPLGGARTAALLKDLIEALVVLHGRPLLHLDVRPANVRLVGERFQLVGFGAARPVGVRAELVERWGGEPGFRAQELIAGDVDPGPRADLYALGATVWSAAVGRLPERRDELTETGTIYGLPPLHTRGTGLPEEISDLVMDLLRVRAERRPGSAGAVRERLRSPARAYSIVGVRELRNTAQVAAVIGGVTSPVLRRILLRSRGLRLARFLVGDVLCAEGEASHHAYLLLQGRLAVSRAGETLACIDAQGEIVGETAAITGERRTATVQADTTCEVIVFNGAELMEFLRDNPEAALQMVANLAERLVRESARRVD